MTYFYETVPMPEGKVALRRGRTAKTGSPEWAANMASRNEAPKFDEQEFHARMAEFGVEGYPTILGAENDPEKVAELLSRIMAKVVGRPAKLMTWEAKTKEQATLIRMFFGVEGWAENRALEDK